MSAQHPGGPPRSAARQVLSERPVRSLLSATVLLHIGTAIQFTAVAKQVYDTTGNELDLAWIGLAEFAPAVLLVLVAGSVIDRFDRRFVAMGAIAVELLGAVALLLFAMSEPTTVWPIFLIALVYGVGRAFHAPALRSMPPMVAPDGKLPAVIALFSAAFTCAYIVGPAAAGFLYAGDPALAYATTAGFLVLGLAMLSRVTFVRRPKPPAPGERPSLRAATEGLRFIRRTPVLLGAISLDLFAVLLGGAVALLPVIAEERLGAGDIGYGMLRAAIGIGAAITALALAWRPLTRRVGPTLFFVVAIFGAGTILLGATRSYAVAFVTLMVISGADMVSMFIRGSLTPLVTPSEAHGRVMAVENVFIGASNEMGSFESGFVAHLIGTPATVIGGGIGTLVVVGAWLFMFPALRRIDRFDDVIAPPTPAPAVAGAP